MKKLQPHQIFTIRNQSQNEAIRQRNTAEIRARLQKDIEKYLADGNEIEVLPYQEPVIHRGVIF